MFLLNYHLQPEDYGIKLYIMTKIFFIPLALLCVGLGLTPLGAAPNGAPPLEGGFALAPSASASPVEKAAAYQEARRRLLAAAGRYEHTPYRYGGIDKNGLDCSGLVYVSFRDALGINVPRDSGGLYAWTEKIPIENAQGGDLVFFITAGGSKISHVGIYAGNGRFIHSASEGPVTGVMYSGLDEKYWSRTFAGAGRALPSGDTGGAGKGAAAAGPSRPEKEKPAAKEAKEPKSRGNILMGVAAAPTWGMSKYDGKNIFRGAAGQFRLGEEVKPFGKPMIFGMELRPEWDGTLGVFRLPVTLSWGMDDKLRIFAGPAVSLGDASLEVSGKNRRYTGGTSWFGAAGITASPFILQAAGAEWSIYGELAWQSYLIVNDKFNFGADLTAALRFSTGLRCSWRLK